MNCLYCGKILAPDEESGGWHQKCIQEFFGTSQLPEAELSDRILESLASKSISQKTTVPGVQKKLSLHLLSQGSHPRLTVLDDPSGYILKPQADEFDQLPEYEHLTMQMARAAGIKTVQEALINTPGSLSYITKRIDRVFYGEGQIEKRGMEDFCQLLRRQVRDKYKGSYERCAQVILKYSMQPMLDLTDFFILLLFCFITGNSDMHLKNFSLIETEPFSNSYRLCPAYDLLPVNLVFPSDPDQMALTLNGKKNHLKRGDFLKFACKVGIPEAAAVKMTDEMISREDLFCRMADESLLNTQRKEDYKALIRSRIQDLKKQG